MPNHIPNKLVIPGAMLKPGFSVYLFVIAAKGKKYYYVGMTGDNYYPSARSAIHRLSGHFEKKNNSTQNQIWKALEEKNISEDEISSVEMYHWPVDGYKPWSGELFHFNKNTLNEVESKKYKNYIKIRLKVFDLEQYLINEVRMECGDCCLNEAIRRTDFEPVEYKNIVKRVLELIK